VILAIQSEICCQKSGAESLEASIDGQFPSGQWNRLGLAGALRANCVFTKTGHYFNHRIAFEERWDQHPVWLEKRDSVSSITP